MESRDEIKVYGPTGWTGAHLKALEDYFNLTAFITLAAPYHVTLLDANAVPMDADVSPQAFGALFARATREGAIPEEDMAGLRINDGIAGWLASMTASS